MDSDFSCTTPRLLNLTINITDSNGNTLYKTATSIYLTTDGATISGLSGNAIVCTCPKESSSQNS